MEKVPVIPMLLNSTNNSKEPITQSATIDGLILYGHLANISLKALCAEICGNVEPCQEHMVIQF